jgi:hypothetical protein
MHGGTNCKHTAIRNEVPLFSVGDGRSAEALPARLRGPVRLPSNRSKAFKRSPSLRVHPEYE